MATRGTETLLARLSRLNVTAVFLASTVVLLLGLLLPGPLGGVVLLLVAGGLGALMAVTWPHTPPRLLVVRVVLLTVLIALGVLKFT